MANPITYEIQVGINIPSFEMTFTVVKSYLLFVFEIAVFKILPEVVLVVAWSYLYKRDHRFDLPQKINPLLRGHMFKTDE